MEPTTILLGHKLSAIFQAGLSFFQKANIGKAIDKHRRENMAASQEEYQRLLTRQEKQNFTHAAADGRTELLTTLLSTQQLNVNKADAAGTEGVNINHKGARKLTPLQLAEMKRNLVCASLLRSAGAQ